jgi:hypothetical protein
MGLEPMTYGLKGHRGHEQIRGVRSDLIPSGSFVAQRVLELATRRDPEVLEAARALASIVLAGDDVRLAEKIIEGGRFTAIHAVQLAERMLSPAHANVDLARGSESTAARAGGTRDITVARR